MVPSSATLRIQNYAWVRSDPWGGEAHQPGYADWKGPIPIAGFTVCRSLGTAVAGVVVDARNVQVAARIRSHSEGSHAVLSRELVHPKYLARGGKFCKKEVPSLRLTTQDEIS